MLEGDAERARPLFERSLELFRPLGDSTGSRSISRASPSRALRAATPRRAYRVEESLEILRALGDRRNVAKVLVVAADINADLGDTETAAGQLAEALTLFVEFGDRWFWGWSLEIAAPLAASVGDPERAARLFGAADAVWAAIGAPLPGELRDRHDRVLADLRGLLGEDRFETASDEGRSCRSARRSIWSTRSARASGTRGSGGADRPRGRGAGAGRRGSHRRRGCGASRRQHPHRPRASPLDLSQARRAHAKRCNALRPRA